MAGQALPIAVTVTYANPEVAAVTAAFTLVMGAAPTSNTNEGGTRTTVYALQQFSVNPATGALQTLFTDVIGRARGMVGAAVTVTLSIVQA